MLRSWRRDIRFETQRFLIRTLKLSDVTPRLLGWAADPDVMGPFNTAPRRMSFSQVRGYIASFNNGQRLILGIFDKATGLAIGVFIVVIDSDDLTATLKVLIGDKDFWGKGVVLEARAGLLEYLFESLGMEKAIGKPFARNFPSIYNYKAQGFRLEGTLRGQCRAVDGGPRLDQLVFGLLREEWRAMRQGSSSR